MPFASRPLIAVAVGMLVVPTAAFASITVVDQVRSTTTPAASCVVQEPGANATTFTNDSTGPLLAVDGTTSVVGSLTLLQSTIRAEGFPGERIVYPDVLRIFNHCDAPGTLTITIGSDAAGTPPASGAWTDVNMSVHLSVVGPPAAGADLANPAIWHPTSATVAGGTVTNPTSGSVSIAPGGRIQLAVVIDAGTSVSTSTAAELRWVAAVTL